MNMDYDLAVIGGGPAGYVAAIRASQLGLKTVCIESRKTFGGTCLNVGCIPSKALLQSTEAYHNALNHLDDFGVSASKVSFDLAKMLNRKNSIVDGMTKGIEGLFKKNKVTSLIGKGCFVDKNTIEIKSDSGESSRITTKNTLIATGSEPIELGTAPFDEDTILSSTEALELDQVPKKLVVVGGGVIGLELGSVWARLGSQVTIIEAASHILPNMDQDIVRTMKKSLTKLGMTFYENTLFKGIKVNKRISKITCQKGGNDITLDCDKLLVCIGRKPFTKGLGLEQIGIATDERGRIPVGENYVTSCSGIYAVGDVIEGPMLAHKAEEEAVACVENIAGVPGHVNYDAIPNVVYTWPEIATVGKSTQELKDLGVPVKVGKFPFLANGRARANNFTEGFVKAIAHAESDKLLGIQIIGAHASELIGEAAIAMEYFASSEDIARSSHAHPTMAEAIKEACLAVMDRTINI